MLAKVLHLIKGNWVYNRTIPALWNAFGYFLSPWTHPASPCFSTDRVRVETRTKERCTWFANWIQGCFPIRPEFGSTDTKRQSSQIPVVSMPVTTWQLAQAGGESICFEFTCFKKFEVWLSYVNSFVESTYGGADYSGLELESYPCYPKPLTSEGVPGGSFYEEFQVILFIVVVLEQTGG